MVDTVTVDQSTKAPSSGLPGISLNNPQRISYGSFLLNNYRWLAGGMLLMLCSSFGQTYFISLFSQQIRADFGLTHGDFGQLYMLATLASAATLLWAGKSLDHFKIATVAGCVFFGLAVFSLSMGLISGIAGLVITLYGLRLFGQGMMTHTAMTAMGKWYVAARGRAVGTAGIGYHLGEGVIPAIIIAALSLFNWRHLWLAGAIMLLLLVPVIAGLFHTERKPGTQELKEAISGHHWTRKEVLKDPLFALLCLGILAPAFIGTAHFFHFIHITEYKQWNTAWASKTFMVLAMMTISWSLIAGWLIDKFSAKRLLPFFLLPLGFGSLILASSSHPWALIVFMALLGFSYGISESLFGALWPEIYGTRHLGSIRAMAVATMVVASALGPGLTGTLIDAGIGYNTQLWAMGAYAIGCSFVMWFVSLKLIERSKQV